MSDLTREGLTKYLISVAEDPGASESRREMARRILERRAPPPRFTPPCPATYGELAAAVMLTEGKLKAAELGLAFDRHLSGVVVWLQLAFGTPRVVYPAPIEATLGDAMLATGRRFTADRAHLNAGVRTLRRICEISSWAESAI